MKINFSIALLIIASLFNFSVGETAILHETDMCDDDNFMTIRPVYSDEATLEERFTTDVCNSIWNGEAFSFVWPQSRKELTNLILSLQTAKENFHNIHIIAICDSPDVNIFRKNLDTLREAIILSSLMKIPTVISIAEKDIYQTIAPAHLGPDSMRITIHSDHIEWRDEECKTIASDFEKSKHILMALISNKKNEFSIRWIPAQSNVHFLLELLELLHKNNGRYSFEIYFS
jgi:hypothetical protein